jgi:Signal transduction histidine kinase
LVVIQRNAIKFSPEQINLKNFVENSTVMCTDGAVKKGINVIYKIPPTLSAKADTHMLQTVIRNLISNAIKFTPENGQITVSASTKNENSVEICITDTGIGMNQEIIDGLFTLNGTICRTGTNREPSTGLGLILCKEFLEKMGGTISVESDEGKREYIQN